jgi:hypothetical protein
MKTDKFKQKLSIENGLLLRSNQIFMYDNIPDSWDISLFEYTLQKNGELLVIKSESGEIYFTDKFTYIGKKDFYDRFTQVNINNPNDSVVNGDHDIGDLVIIKNNSLSISTSEFLSDYIDLMIETVITLKTHLINTRNIFTLIATDNKSRENCLNFMKKLESGDLNILMNNAFLDNVKLLNNNVNSDLIYRLIEVLQYLKASCLHELGINANYDLKRTVTTKSDIDINLDYLIPLVDNMLLARKSAIEKINKMYGSDIKVYLHSTWLNEKLKSEELIHNINPDDLESEKSENESLDNSENEAAINDKI